MAFAPHRKSLVARLIKDFRKVTEPYGEAPPCLERLARETHKSVGNRRLIGALHRFHSFRRQMGGSLPLFLEGIEDGEVGVIYEMIYEELDTVSRSISGTAIAGNRMIVTRVDLEALLLFYADLCGERLPMPDAFHAEEFAKLGQWINLPGEYDYLIERVYGPQIETARSPWWVVLWRDSAWADGAVPSPDLAPLRELYLRRRDGKDREYDDALDEVY